MGRRYEHHLGGDPEMMKKIQFTIADVFAPVAAKQLQEIYVADPHAYIEKHLWIRNKLDRLVMFNLNFIQRDLAAQKMEAVSHGRKPWYLVLKYRQGGITTYEQALSFHRTVVHAHQHCMTICDTDKKTAGIWRMVNRFYDHLDPQVRPERTTAKTTLSIPNLDSIFEFYTAGSHDPGRGFTLSRVHMSEAARYKTKPEEMRELMAGIKEGAANGEIVVETTAQGVGGWFYEEWMQATMGQSAFTPIFLAWYRDPSNRLPIGSNVPDPENAEEEQYAREKYHLDDEQILFRRQKQAEQGKLFAQEFPEDPLTAFLMSGSSYFDIGVIQNLMKTVIPPIEQTPECTFWHQPIPGHRYWIGADCSEGNLDSDFSAAVVLDLEGRQCARLHGRWRTGDYARRLAILARRYNDAMLGVEANNHGHAVLTSLQEVEHYGNLFVHYTHEAIASRTGKLGWQTTPKTRPLMLAELEREALREKGMEVNDSIFLAECGTFADDGSGKYQARQGCHDDLVMAWAIAWQLRKQNAGEFKAYVL